MQSLNSEIVNFGQELYTALYPATETCSAIRRMKLIGRLESKLQTMN
jgi:hypothetical protein